MPSGPHPRTLQPLLLPLAALLAVLPLILHGGSCGQDIAFHIQSWLDASTQLRHGHYPHWAFTPAWNAGEPRFIFYPPLSWLLGALLTSIVPIPACPVIFIFLALLASGLTFYKLANHFVSPNAALLASAFYLANPYMLFNAFERSAFAELLAAAWIPLLLLALLQVRPTARGIAIPLALLWLTNAPAAVMGSYLLAVIATLRVLQAFYASLSSRPKLEHERTAVESGTRLALTYLAGTLLGLTLPAFYLLPAACERKYVQVAMAILPNLRFQDNFLFTRTTDAAHNAVNHTASTLALTLLILTAATLFTLLLRNRRSLNQQPLTSTEHSVTPPGNPVISTETSRPHPMCTGETPVSFPDPAILLTVLFALITLLLFPISTPIWDHLPDLAFLQFPWRLLTLLAPILALSLALLFQIATTRYPEPLGSGLITPHRKRGFSPWGGLYTKALSLTLPLVLGLLAYHLYGQACDPTGNPATIAHLLSTHHGTLPTDEYTPANADNDVLRTGNPGYWLAHSPNDPAPNTLPTAAELDPHLDTDDNPVPDAQTLSTPAPHHFTLTTTVPGYLVLNLRDYPNWRITRTANATTTQLSPTAQSDRRPRRTDGLLAIALPSGRSTIDITWRRTPDQTLGLVLSILALVALAFTCIKPRTLPRPPSVQDLT